MNGSSSVSDGSGDSARCQYKPRSGLGQRVIALPWPVCAGQTLPPSMIRLAAARLPPVGRSGWRADHRGE